MREVAAFDTADGLYDCAWCEVRGSHMTAPASRAPLGFPKSHEEGDSLAALTSAYHPRTAHAPAGEREYPGVGQRGR
jgi:hypothetical protein